MADGLPSTARLCAVPKVSRSAFPINQSTLSPGLFLSFPAADHVRCAPPSGLLGPGRCGRRVLHVLRRKQGGLLIRRRVLELHRRLRIIIRCEPWDWRIPVTRPHPVG